MRTFVSLDTQDLPDAYDAEALGAPPLVEVKEAAGRIDLAYRFPGFFRIDREHAVRGQPLRFEALEIAGVGHLLVSGRPQLPSFGRFVQIPPECEFKVTVKTPGRPVQLDGLRVAPAQERLTDGPAAPALEYDEACYASDEPFPKELVTVTGPMVVDGYDALLVHVCPFQVRPARQLLVAYPRVEVSIALTARATAPASADAGGGREVFGNLFLNPRRGVAPRVGLPATPIHPILSGPELLIVHPTAFAAAAHRLADWKNHRGLETALLEFKDDISTPAKAAAAFTALQAEIRRRRSALGARLRYVVLLGDVDDIPAQRDTGRTTDYYLSTRADPTATQPLPMPWLALGRIPIRDAAEAQAVVDQIIAYERTPPPDPSYYHRFMCAAHFETHLESGTGHLRDGRDYAFTLEAIRAHLAAQGYDAERVYTCDNAVTTAHPLYYMNGAAVPPDVVAALAPPADATQRLVAATSEGCLIIAHRDHGDVDGWYMPPFKLADLDHVTGAVPSMFYSVNCLTGAFQAGTATECFAEKNLRLPGTAPTLIASTELSNTWHNNAMMLALFDAMYGGLIPTFPGSTVSYPIRHNRFGDIVNYARSYLAVAFASDPAGLRANYEMYHVLGDPSLEVWADEPRPLRLATRLVPLGLQVELSAPAPDCVVTVWCGNHLLRRMTPTGQRFVIPLSTLALPKPLPTPPIRRLLTLCAWAPGFRFAEARVVVPIVKPPIPVA